MAQNLALYSQQFSNAAWAGTQAGTTRTDNQVTAPDGTLTASSIAFVSVAYCYQNITIVPNLPRTYTFSVWLYSPTKTAIVLHMSGSVANVNTVITITAGWTRYQTSYTTTRTDSVVSVGFDNRVAVGGDGIAGTVYAWGAQLTQANWAGDYVVTTSAAVGTTTPPVNIVSEGGQNLLTQSSTLSNAAWTLANCTITSNAIANPLDGAINADAIVESNAAGGALTHTASATTAPTTAIGRIYTLSWFAKAGTRSWCALQIGGSYCYFNLSGAGSVGTIVGTFNNTIVAIGSSGWYRCSVSYVTIAIITATRLYAVNADNVSTYTSVNGQIAIYAHGAQLTQGNQPGDYVATTTLAVGTTTPPINLARSTNLIFQSEDLSNAAWTKNTSVVATANTAEVLDPVGGNTAAKLACPTAAAYIFAQAASGIAFPIGSIHAAGVWLRTATGTRAINVYNNTAATSRSYTITTDWQFCSGDFLPRPALSINSTATVRIDNVVSNGAFTLYAWHPQLNRGDKFSPYIATTATAANASDVATPASLVEWEAPHIVGNCVFWWSAESLIDRSKKGDAYKNLVKSASNPTYTASDSGYNGQPTYAFGSAQYLVSGAWKTPLTQPCTVYVVGNIPGASTYFYLDGIDTTNRIGIAGLTGAISTYAGTFLSSGITSTAKHVICSTVNGASSTIYVDAYTTANATGNAGVKQMNGITIGNTFNFSTNMNGGKVAEIICFSGIHTLAQRTLITKYLGSKYAIAVA